MPSTLNLFRAICIFIAISYGSCFAAVWSLHNINDPVQYKHTLSLIKVGDVVVTSDGEKFGVTGTIKSGKSTALIPVKHPRGSLLRVPAQLANLRSNVTYKDLVTHYIKGAKIFSAYDIPHTNIGLSKDGEYALVETLPAQQVLLSKALQYPDRYPGLENAIRNFVKQTAVLGYVQDLEFENLAFDPMSSKIIFFDWMGTQYSFLQNAYSEPTSLLTRDANPRFPILKKLARQLNLIVYEERMKILSDKAATSKIPELFDAPMEVARRCNPNTRAGQYILWHASLTSAL